LNESLDAQVRFAGLYPLNLARLHAERLRQLLLGHSARGAKLNHAKAKSGQNALRFRRRHLAEVENDGAAINTSRESALRVPGVPVTARIRRKAWWPRSSMSHPITLALPRGREAD
jgi:hypothetical protein